MARRASETESLAKKPGGCGIEVKEARWSRRTVFSDGGFEEQPVEVCV
jgi:hypothetical protein